MHAGPPKAVKSVMVYSSLATIILTWEAPFSFDLLAVEPDIAYCIEVYRITKVSDGWREEKLHSNCSVLVTVFSYQCIAPDPTDRFQFIITPRSYVEGAKNGTPSEPILAAFLGIIMNV